LKKVGNLWESLLSKERWSVLSSNAPIWNYLLLSRLKISISMQINKVPLLK